ncbi:MAG: hypothetical protein H0U74_23965 [Bradymonadaceae bacterium]|nr:hypothetical protein [Lujinxingiaceae bacterium]
MAKINIKDAVAHDRTLVYETFRDNLKELVPYLPNIESITVEKRDQANENTVKVVNLWKAKGEEVPAMAQAFIKPEMLQWHDHATWHDDSHSCEWVMQVGFLREAISCKGTTTYLDKGGKTEIVMDGELKVDASKIPGVPRIVAGRVGDAVEKFVVRLITPNLTQVNRGVEQYLVKK